MDAVYDPVLLRTFLAVAGAGSFTAAGLQLGLSQPTVSQHIRRLEDSVGRPLILRDTRAVRLTDAGDALTGFAQSILASHAAAERYFEAGAMKGRLRFGASDDLAITQLPRILRHFRSSNPQVSLELSVGQSEALTRRLAAGQLDLVFVKQQVGAGVADGTLVLRDAFVWVADESVVVEPDAPVPFVAYRAPSPSRRMAIAALEEAGRRWRITCTVRDIGGLISALRAGIGVAVFPHSLIPHDLIKVSNRFSLPELGQVDFRLLANPASPQEAIDALASAIQAKTLGPAPAGSR
jgi:DNA-binding transcriptional LysR family regulator